MEEKRGLNFQVCKQTFIDVMTQVNNTNTIEVTWRSGKFTSFTKAFSTSSLQALNTLSRLLPITCLRISINNQSTCPIQSNQYYVILKQVNCLDRMLSVVHVKCQPHQLMSCQALIMLIIHHRANCFLIQKGTSKCASKDDVMSTVWYRVNEVMS